MKHKSWSNDSWQKCDNTQQIDYDDNELFQRVYNKLSKLPPLTNQQDTISLKKHIENAQQGNAFIFQGGDCAEMFDDVSEDNVMSLMHALTHASDLLHEKLNKDIFIIGRFAGQFSKPRSSLWESKGNDAIHSYRGDMINDYVSDASLRKPNPKRMLSSYFHSSALLNHLANERLSYDIKRYSQNEDVTNPPLYRKVIYSSHELLNLYYEQALLRDDHIKSTRFCSSAHFVWIGNRTRSLTGAHIEFVRGITNPIGIKVDAHIRAEELIALIERVNPDNEPGKVSLILRMGVSCIKQGLPLLIKEISSRNKRVTWMVDPMHANTHFLFSGYKVRYLEDILSETNNFFSICNDMNVPAGGIHLEMSGDNSLIECISKSDMPNDFGDHYKSGCDPRLTSSQVKTLLQLVRYR